LPRISNEVAGVVEIHTAVDHLTEQMVTVKGGNRYEVDAIRGIIPAGEPQTPQIVNDLRTVTHRTLSTAIET